MQRIVGSKILSLGHYAPEQSVDNLSIERRLSLPAGWIRKRTGIERRRYAAAYQSSSDLACAAGEAALAGSETPRAGIGLTLLATSTPDHLLPPTAPLVAHRLGLPQSGAVDLTGACAGFLYAILFADAWVRMHATHVLVIAANILSRRINPDDRASASLFADAAGAVLLGPSAGSSQAILSSVTIADGSGYDLIRILAGGSRMPYAPELAPADFLMEITDGGRVFLEAVRIMTECSHRVLAEAKLDAAGVTCFVPHQANARMMSAVAKNLQIADDRIISTITDYGNSSAATIPFSLSYHSAVKPFQVGDRVLVAAAGAGLTGGAAVLGF